MSLSSQVGLLATRVGTELKQIRNNYVPNLLRGPIGGVSDGGNVSGTINLDPALSNHRRITLTGATTIGLMSAGTDGQRVLVEAGATGQQVLTFDVGYELSRAVTTRSFTIPSGGWAYVQMIYRSGTWRLISAEPQVVPDYTPPSLWLPADHGLLAWTIDPAGVDFTVANGGGTLVGSSVKCNVNDISTGVSYNVNTAGSGFTANRNYIGIWDSAGTLIGQTADLASTWNTTGVKTSSWTSALNVTAGATYYVGYIATATTAPVFAAASGGFGLTARGRSALAWRGSVESVTGRTALPTTRPTPTGTVNAMWFGLA